MHIKKNLTIQIWRFLIVGIFANMVNFVFYHFLYIQSNLAFTSSIFGYAAGMILSYLGGRFWTFGGNKYLNKAAYLIFIIIYVASGIMMATLIHVFVMIIDVHHAVAWCIGASAAIILNFFGQKFIVFKD